MKKQHGFVLISVLLITTISSMFALNAIGENRLQENIAGNQKKEINARMKAEKGVFDSFSYIQTQNQLDQLTHEQIRDNLNQHIHALDGDIYILDASVDVDGTFVFVSQGDYQGATAYLKVKIKAHKPGGDPLFTNAITGCEGVTLSGSGEIDSFNSTIGDYKGTYNGIVNKGDHADVTTLGVKQVDAEGNISYQGADILLSGDSPIHGNANASGNFTSDGSGHVIGDVNANGNVEFIGKDVSSTGPFMISGDVSVGGDALINSNKIGGAISVVGTASNTDNVAGIVSYGLDGGVSGFDNLYQQDIDVTSPNIAMGECDTQGLMPTMINGGAPVEETSIYSGMVEQLSNLHLVEGITFNETEANVLTAGVTDGSMTTLAPETLEVLGTDKSVYIFDDFILRSRMITIEGDITLVVKGDFETKGDGSGFKFAEGDTESSLTIITEGQVKIGSESTMFKNAQVKDQNVPLSIYSSYDSALNTGKNAITFNGKTDTYARIYAPLGDVLTTNSGHIMGAVHGRNVEVSGAGGVHYDEALKEVADIKNGFSGTAQFTSVYYYYE